MKWFHLQNKSTGQLSGTVYVANFLGCIARIFTSLQEGGGYAMVRGFLLGMMLPPRTTADTESQYAFFHLR